MVTSFFRKTILLSSLSICHFNYANPDWGVATNLYFGADSTLVIPVYRSVELNSRYSLHDFIFVGASLDAFKRNSTAGGLNQQEIGLNSRIEAGLSYAVNEKLKAFIGTYYEFGIISSSSSFNSTTFISEDNSSIWFPGNQGGTFFGCTYAISADHSLEFALRASEYSPWSSAGVEYLKIGFRSIF